MSAGAVSAGAVSAGAVSAGAVSAGAVSACAVAPPSASSFAWSAPASRAIWTGSALSVAAALAIDAFMAPASMASSTSRDSRSASRSISDGLIDLPSITPPLITRAGLTLAKSRSPLAASTTSPLTKAIAEGPLSSPSSSAAMPASAAASLVRVFLTTLNVARSPSEWRSSASWATVRPRYSASTAPLELWNRSVSSATAATFSALAMGLLSWAGGPGLGRAPAASGVGEGPAKRNAPARGTRAWTPRRPRRGERRFSSDACAGRPQCAGPSATPCQARGDNRRSLAALSLPVIHRASCQRRSPGTASGAALARSARVRLAGWAFFGEAAGLARGQPGCSGPWWWSWRPSSGTGPWPPTASAAGSRPWRRRSSPPGPRR